MRATGTAEKDWAITSVDSDKILQDAKDPAASPATQMRAIFALMSKHGCGGDYNSKVVGYEKLGVAAEHVDAMMKRLAQELDV
ncbi:hypothetical protein RRF57_012757 [Xylaria bambusicola]|uniref:Uncharacterized protein n=1 Tax=Xylaria bambusicola TaxID=326684 RepID=A0AAN7UQG7_9PEZI